MKWEKTASWLTISAALLALVALAFISTTCGGGGGRKPPGTTPVTTPFTGTTEWVHTWGGSGHDYAHSLAVDDKGDIYVTGYIEDIGAGSKDVLLLKYSPEGNVLWQKTWGGSYDDWATEIEVDGNGDIYVTGTVTGLGAGRCDALLLKYSPEGNLLWQRAWGGRSWDSASGLAISEGGCVYVVGDTFSFGFDNEWEDAFLLCYSLLGELVWQKTWGGDMRDSAKAVVVEGDESIYVTGSTSSFGEGGYVDAFLFRYSPSGSLIWQRTWGRDGYDSGYAVQIDGVGDVFVAGLSSWVVGGSYALLLRYSSHGTLLGRCVWKRRSRGYRGSFYDLAVKEEGRALLVGYADSSIDNDIQDPYMSDALIIGLSSKSAIYFQQIWEGAGSSLATGVATDDPGNIYLCGTAFSIDGSWRDPDEDSSSNAEIDWEPEGVEGAPNGIETIPNGTVTILEGTETEPEGIIDEGGGDFDVLIMKYDPS